MSYEWAIQTAVYSRLKGDSALMAMVKGVFDSVPQVIDAGVAADYPYITLGEDIHLEWDTDTEQGSDCTITTHVWSRYRGRKEVKEIQGRIFDMLHRASFTVTGYNLVDCFWIQSDSFMDADGLTRHGVQTFRIIIED